MPILRGRLRKEVVQENVLSLFKGLEARLRCDSKGLELSQSMRPRKCGVLEMKLYRSVGAVDMLISYGFGVWNSDKCRGVKILLM